METLNIKTIKNNVSLWYKAAKIENFPKNGGACVLVNGQQIAVFNFSETNEWYATQNMCPHKYEMALSRGLIGDNGAEPKISCPFHKKSFSLKTGQCLTGDPYQIEIYPVKIEDGFVHIGLSGNF